MSRGLCDKMIDGTGYHQNYSLPYLKYFEWFIDGFRTLKKAKEVEAELAAAGGAARRVLQSMFDQPLEFGPIDIHKACKCTKLDLVVDC